VRDCVIAVDVGGTMMKGAVVGREGTAMASLRRATDRERGPDAVVNGAVSLAEALASRAGENRLVAGAVAVPGTVDEAAGIARSAANLGWRDVPLAGLISKRLGVPMALGHDVRAGALAEGHMGSGRGIGDFLFITLGTGVGGAIVSGGRILAGVHSRAGEIGHLVVRPGGTRCACGNRGCLETIASAPALIRRYSEIAGGADSITAELVVGRIRDGDDAAARVWADAVEALAVALAAYVTLLDPELVILGGGVGSVGALLLDPLRTAMTARLSVQKVPGLATAALGDGAGCMGAALLAWRLAGVPDERLQWKAT
jgi:glucokinase